MLLLADEDNDDVIESFWQKCFSVLQSFTFYCQNNLFLNFSFPKNNNNIPTKTTAAQNEVALSYHGVCGLYFLAVVFVTTIV